MTWIKFAPAGTPQDIVTRHNTAVARILRSAQTRGRLHSFGAGPIDNTRDEFTAYVNSECVKWAKVVKAAGLRE